MGEPFGRQSLVTPIDWKLDGVVVICNKAVWGRQYLVTPIDWKRLCRRRRRRHLTGDSRQSLVTPIDWKPLNPIGVLVSLPY